MSDPQNAHAASDPRPDPGNTSTGDETGTPLTAADMTGLSTSEADVANLTPEEQMALFEKEMKEDDWGHQPC